MRVSVPELGESKVAEQEICRTVEINSFSLTRIFTVLLRKVASSLTPLPRVYSSVAPTVTPQTITIVRMLSTPIACTG